jgi:hypothetical protein
MPESNVRLTDFQAEVLLYLHTQYRDEKVRNVTLDAAQQKFARHPRRDQLSENIWNLMELGLIEEPSSGGKVRRKNYRITEEGRDQADFEEARPRKGAPASKVKAAKPAVAPRGENPKGDDWDDDKPQTEEPARKLRATRKKKRVRPPRTGAASDVASQGSAGQS